MIIVNELLGTGRNKFSLVYKREGRRRCRPPCFILSSPAVILQTPSDEYSPQPVRGAAVHAKADNIWYSGGLGTNPGLLSPEGPGYHYWPCRGVYFDSAEETARENLKGNRLDLIWDWTKVWLADLAGQAFFMYEKDVLLSVLTGKSQSLGFCTVQVMTGILQGTVFTRHRLKNQTEKEMQQHENQERLCHQFQ